MRGEVYAKKIPYITRLSYDDERTRVHTAGVIHFGLSKSAI